MPPRSFLSGTLSLIVVCLLLSTPSAQADFLDDYNLVATQKKGSILFPQEGDVISLEPGLSEGIVHVEGWWKNANRLEILVNGQVWTTVDPLPGGTTFSCGPSFCPLSVNRHLYLADISLPPGQYEIQVRREGVAHRLADAIDWDCFYNTYVLNPNGTYCIARIQCETGADSVNVTVDTQ